MFSLLSFKENGDKLEHAGQTPAFYALTFNGEIVEYYGTIEALRCAHEALSVNLMANQETVEFELSEVA